MAKKYETIEDIPDIKLQRLVTIIAKVFHNGDVQAVLDDLNANAEKSDAEWLEAKEKGAQPHTVV